MITLSLPPRRTAATLFCRWGAAERSVRARVDARADRCGRRQGPRQRPGGRTGRPFIIGAWRARRGPGMRRRAGLSWTETAFVVLTCWSMMGGQRRAFCFCFCDFAPSLPTVVRRHLIGMPGPGTVNAPHDGPIQGIHRDVAMEGETSCVAQCAGTRLAIPLIRSQPVRGRAAHATRNSATHRATYSFLTFAMRAFRASSKES